MLKKQPLYLYLLVVVALALFIFLLTRLYLLYLQNNPPRYPGVYACSPLGECVVYQKSNVKQFCPIYFNENNCQQSCQNTANLCSQ